MRHLQLYEKFVNVEDETRTMAWLYFLTHVYEEGMPDKGWSNDMRMGVKFSDAMIKLKSEGLVKHDGKKWTALPKATDKIRDFFGTFKTRTEAEESGEDLVKYDIPGLHGYRISDIPFYIFQKDFTKDSETGRVNLLDREAYWDIIKWWDVYQREPTRNWSYKLNKYLGYAGDLFKKRDEYVFYRGIFLREGSIADKYSVGDLISDNRISWTTSKYSASRFATNNKTTMDRMKLKEGQAGLVLEYSFEEKQILMEAEWVENHEVLGPHVDFPQEAEVVVKPFKKNAKIIQILRPDETH